METQSISKKTFSRIGFAILVTGVLTFALQILCSAVASALIEAGRISGESSWLMWILTFVPIYVVGIPVGLLIMRKMPVAEYTTSKLGVKNFLIFFPIAYCFMYFGNLIGTILSFVLSGGTAENALNAYALDTNPIKVVVMVILAPLLEELVFRKFIIDRCSKYGEKLAILYSAVAFGLFHMNLFQLFYAFGIGLVLGYMYIRTRRLRYPVLLHMIVNFLGAVVAPWVLGMVDIELLSDPAALMSMTEEMMMEMLPGLLIYFGYAFSLIIVAMVGLVLLIVMAKKLVFKPTEEELPKGQRFKTAYCNLGTFLFVVFCVIMCIVSLVI